MKKLWLGTVKLDLLLLTSELPCGSKSEFLKQMKKTEHEAHSNFSLLLQVTHLNWQYAGIGRAYKLEIRIYSDFFKSINRSKKKNELQWDVWMNIFIIFIWLSFNAKNEKIYIYIYETKVVLHLCSAAIQKPNVTFMENLYKLVVVHNIMCILQ